MKQSLTKFTTEKNNPELRAVKSPRRRRILRLLEDRSSPVDVAELCTHLAAAELKKSLISVTEEEVQSRRIDLIHTQFPILEDAELITWDSNAGTVTTTNSPTLADPQFQRIIEADMESGDTILTALTHHHRRVALSILKDHDGPIEINTLAKAIADQGTDSGITTDSETIKDVCASLHHVHLPKLQQAGLIEYDADAGLISYEGHPALEDLVPVGDETSRAIVSTTHHSDDLWSIEGRANVIARGQSLFDQADDELFLMVTTDGLLEEGCIRRLQDATDRGVDVYLGSQTPEVRDLVRERVPEAVIWEPQMDWLNLPPNYEKVGRLVFADREAVMLGTIGEETDAGVPAETAITGSGKNNPLVTLMRELLGSRLDHLDAQSEDFRSQIPL